MFKLKSSEINILLALLVVVLGVWAFIELGDEVRERDTLSYDNQILLSLRDPGNLSDPLGPQWMEETMRDLTSLGSQAVLIVLILAVSGFLMLRKQYRQALLIALTSISGVLLVVGLKFLFIRERPDVVPHLVEVTSKSYPSGHSMMSAVVYLSLAAMLAPILKRYRVKIYVISVALVLTFLVGLSRVYMGVHYPSDVLSGWAVGLAWAALSWLLFQYLSRKYSINEKSKHYDTTT